MEDEIASSGMSSWPVPVRIYEGNEKLVRLNGLPQGLKQQAWAEIRANCPPLANLLKEPTLQDVVQYFSADIFVEAHYAPCLPPERPRGRKD
jgi:hypothetical protein